MLPLVVALLVPTSRIEVVVVERETGKPIPSFHLHVTPLHSHDWISRDVAEPSGRVVVDVAEGPAMVGVTADGFRDVAYQQVDVSPTSSPILQFSLERSNALRVHVRDARTGKPIAGAKVVLGRTWLNLLFAPRTTDARGDLDVRSLPAARFSVTVHAPTYRQLIVGGIGGDADDDQRLDLALDDGDGLTELVGIGARIGDGARVIDVSPDGSAAGVLAPGDVVVRVDGVWSERLPKNDVIELLLGPEHTKVTVDVRRADRILRFVLERRRVVFFDPGDLARVDDAAHVQSRMPCASFGSVS